MTSSNVIMRKRKVFCKLKSLKIGIVHVGIETVKVKATYHQQLEQWPVWPRIPFGLCRSLCRTRQYVGLLSLWTNGKKNISNFFQPIPQIKIEFLLEWRNAVLHNVGSFISFDTKMILGLFLYNKEKDKWIWIRSDFSCQSPQLQNLFEDNVDVAGNQLRDLFAFSRLNWIVLIRIVAEIERESVWWSGPAAYRRQRPYFQNFFGSFVEAQDRVFGHAQKARGQFVFALHFFLKKGKINNHNMVSHFGNWE